MEDSIKDSIKYVKETLKNAQATPCKDGIVLGFKFSEEVRQAQGRQCSSIDCYNC